MNTDQFLKSKAFGVVGVSNNRTKYGNKVLRCYLQNNKTVYPVHYNDASIEGVKCIKEIKDLPEDVESLSMITPPPVTEEYVQQAIKKGIKNIWMQPGAESQKAIKDCLENGINVIAGGPCILVKLGFSET
jgi:predicted CoA-binding protein